VTSFEEDVIYQLRGEDQSFQRFGLAFSRLWPTAQHVPMKYLVAASSALLIFVACHTTTRSVDKLEAPDPYTLIANRHLVSGIEARALDGLIHVVIEIPAGTTAKWEVSKDDGSLRWEFKNDKPRIVKYLAYPGNYGMVPSTLLPKHLGGDGDPLDVLVLGPAVARGSVVRARVIGVLKLHDGGEQDDKLIAVMEGTALAGIADMVELDSKFNGVSSIIETWFSNYKGPGKMESLGFAGPEAAHSILNAAIGAFDSPMVEAQKILESVGL